MLQVRCNRDWCLTMHVFLAGLLKFRTLVLLKLLTCSWGHLHLLFNVIVCRYCLPLFLYVRSCLCGLKNTVPMRQQHGVLKCGFAISQMGPLILCTTLCRGSVELLHSLRLQAGHGFGTYSGWKESFHSSRDIAAAVTDCLDDAGNCRKLFHTAVNIQGRQENLKTFFLCQKAN